VKALDWTRGRMSRSRADGATKFIILCAARTGSTMLRELLDSHPEVCCYGEIMASAVTPDRWDSEAPNRRKLLEQYRIKYESRGAPTTRGYSGG